MKGRRHSLIVLLLALVTLVSAGAHAATFTSSLPLTPAELVVPFGETVTVTLPDGLLDLPELPENEYYGEVSCEYHWSVPGGPSGDGRTATIPSSASRSAGEITAPGSYVVEFTGRAVYTVCWQEDGIEHSDGPSEVILTASEGGRLSQPFRLVKVASVSCENVTSTTDTPGTSETLVIPVGYNNGFVTLTAAPTPLGIWPSGKPLWSGATASAQNPATATLSTIIPGTYIVTAICGTSQKTLNVIIVKIAFSKTEDKVNWFENGTYNASNLLTDDSEKSNLSWNITGTPTASINANNGLIYLSNTYIYNLEKEGTYTITATHNMNSLCSASFTLMVVAYLKIPAILKRKEISLKSDDDKYGHWWIELNNNESYGWWPDRYVNIWDTLTSVPGILNGQPPAPFGGTEKTDPHHADTADISIQTYVISHERTISETIMDIRNFANNYSGTWSWPFGQNCHSFQNSMVNSVRLIKEDELP